MNVPNQGDYKSRLIADRGYKQLFRARFEIQDVYDHLLELYNTLDTAKGNVIEEYTKEVKKIKDYMDDMVDDTKNYYEKMNENADVLDAKLKQILETFAGKEHVELEGFPQTDSSDKNSNRVMHKEITDVYIGEDGNIKLNIRVYDTITTYPDADIGNFNTSSVEEVEKPYETINIIVP